MWAVLKRNALIAKECAQDDRPMRYMLDIPWNYHLGQLVFVNGSAMSVD